MTQDRVELVLSGFCTAPNGECQMHPEPHRCLAQGPEGDAWICPWLELEGKPKPSLAERQSFIEKSSEELRKDLKGFMNYDLKPDTHRMCEYDAEGDT